MVTERTPLAIAGNLALDAALFQWAERVRPARVVYVSSSAAYPIAFQNGKPRVALLERLLDGDPVREPDGLYGWIKVTGERLAALARDAGVNVTVVRPFSGYGPGQDEDYPFPAIAARVLAGQTPIWFWGNGAQVRDFVHVTDVTGAILAAVEQGVDGPVNIGTGVGTSILELVRKMAREAGRARVAIEPLTKQPVGVRYRVADTTLLRSFYEPRVTLEQGIREAINGRP